MKEEKMHTHELTTTYIFINETMNQESLICLTKQNDGKNDRHRVKEKVPTLYTLYHKQ